MSQSVGLGVPLSSNNRANINTPLGGGGTQLAGVESLNSQSGNLDIVGDASIGISAIGSGQLQVSTAGKPQVVGPITCAGAITATGALTAAGVTTGGVTASGLTVSGSAAIPNISGTTTVATSVTTPLLYGIGMAPFPPVAATGQADGRPAGTFVLAGVRIMWGIVDNGATPGLNFNVGPAAATFSFPPVVIAVPNKYSPAIGYATINGVTTTTCGLQLTTSSATGFSTSCHWLAIGPA